jgi:very-short-patch-repair endonuclease
VFQPWNAKQVFCTHPCSVVWANSQREYKLAKCGFCAEKFATNRLPKKTGRLFCNAVCYGKFMKSEYAKNNKGKCVMCKKEYVIPPNVKREQRPNRKYCSRQCMFSYWAKNAKTGAMSREEAMFNFGIRATKIHYKKQVNPLAALTSVDFFIPSLNLCVYVDGVYWHGKPGVPERDARQTRVLEAAGFKVLRISDVEVRRIGVDGVKALIEEIAGKTKGSEECLKAI